MELLDCIKIYLYNSPFYQGISYRSISAMCHVYHHSSYRTSDTYKWTSGTYNFNFIAVVKVSVFMSKFWLFDIPVDSLLHLKHKELLYCMLLQRFSIAAPLSSHTFCLLKVIVAMTINRYM